MSFGQGGGFAGGSSGGSGGGAAAAVHLLRLVLQVLRMQGLESPTGIGTVVGCCTMRKYI